MYMRWQNLAFFHWPVPVEALRAAVPAAPAGLEVDTFDGTAWIGLVPFTMPLVRHAFLPRIPTMHDFHECNVRTYVTADNTPGVWFFSLDAASKLAVMGARWLWHLNYVHARIQLDRKADTTHYSLRRVTDPDITMECRWERGEALPRSQAGSIEHFLTERYCLYASNAKGRVFRGRIWHEPWSLSRARLLELEDDLVPAAGIDRSHLVDEPICHHVETLDVEAWPLRPIS